MPHDAGLRFFGADPIVRIYEGAPDCFFPNLFGRRATQTGRKAGRHAAETIFVSIKRAFRREAQFRELPSSRCGGSGAKTLVRT